MENEYGFVPMYGFENYYEITCDGVVRSKKTGNILNGSFDKIGQVMKISLSIEGKRKLVPLHIAVYETFVEPIKVEPGKRFFVKHHDGDPYNCDINNIYISGASIIKKEKAEKKKKKEIVKKIKTIKEARTPKQIKKERPKIEAVKRRQFKNDNKKGENYLNNAHFEYQIILSKGQGKPTRKLEQYFIKIINGIITKIGQGYTYDLKCDAFQNAYLNLHIRYKNYNEKKYDQPFPYFTELVKRNLAYTLNNERYRVNKAHIGPYDRNKFISMSSIYSK